MDAKEGKKLPETPCYVIDTDKLKANLICLNNVAVQAGCKILLAQKAFSAYGVYPLIGQYLHGAAASGLYEARLGKEELVDRCRDQKLENHIFSAAYRADEIDEIARICDHIIFNSFAQLEKFRPAAEKYGAGIGLRVNPECRTQEGHDIYDPCAPGSRLGITANEFKGNSLAGVEGIHFHTLCEQNADALKTTLLSLEEKFGDVLSLPQVKWVNFGGGHHITRADYDIPLLIECIRQVKEKYQVQVYLEPGEAVALNAGYLFTKVLDVVRNGAFSIAILDTSAACHMPDVIEMPYRPPLQGSGEPGTKHYTYRLAGPTCLAGDVIGDYSFDQALKPGDLLVFEDMAIYSMVKNNTFNGMKLPDIVLKSGENYRLWKHFGYDEFKRRL